MPRKSFQASHLELRHKTYFAVLYVPKDVRPIIGKHKFYKSTETSDRTIAEKRAAALVLGWKNEISRARNTSPDPLIAEALELLQNKKRLKHPFLVNDIIEARAEEISCNSSQLAADEFEAIAYGKRIALQTLVSPWILHEKERGLAEKTIDQASRDIELLVNACPTANLLESKYIEPWIKLIYTNGNLTPASITRIISSCRKFFKYLQHIEEIAINTPNPFNVPPQYKRSTKHNAKAINKVKHWIPFTVDEVNLIYMEAKKKDDPQLLNLINIGAYTGARIEELCSLKCDEVKIQSDEIFINESKTSSGIRIVPIHNNIKPLLQQLIKESTDGYVISGLTLNKYGDRSNAIGKRFGRLKTLLKFSEQHKFHSIRKTVVTSLENAGISEGVAADIVGHEKPNITYGLYSGGTSLHVKKKAIKHLSYNF